MNPSGPGVDRNHTTRSTYRRPLEDIVMKRFRPAIPASKAGVRRSGVVLVLGVALAASVTGPATGAVPATTPTPTHAQVLDADRSLSAANGGTPKVTRETFRDPPASVRPGTRWWWDSLVNTNGGFQLDEALEEVEAMADAGFGRFEIAWEGGEGNYGTPSQQAKLQAVAERAEELGLQLDMTLGPGWPWATPRTTGKLGQQELMYGRKEVSGPSKFSGEVEPAIGDDEPRGKLIAVTAARVKKAGPEVTEPGTPPAESTVLAPRSLVNLTERMDGRHLEWKVPKGDWIIFSFWQRNREGNKVSLISERSVRAGLEYIDDNQLGSAEEAVRKVGYSFFEDSLELNAEELYWTPSMQREFAVRRGYKMTKYLPLMFAQGVSDYWVPQDEPVADFELPGGDGARYRYDYYSTITDLYLDNHVKVVGEWAEKYGMQFRTQPAYGNNFEVIRSSREGARAGVLVDDESLNAGDTPFLVSPNNQPGMAPREYYSDPETDQWRFAMDHYRQVTSGSHQGGALEVTTELGAWFGRELATTLREYKRMMDKEWAAGVTRPLLHGMTHSPEDTTWPGASHFVGLVGESVNHRTWPEWQHFAPLSDYWGRGALVLQQGAARTDVAILRDSFVTTAAGTDPVRSFFDAEGLERRGFTIGYVDPTGVQRSPLGKQGQLFPRGPSYDVLVVDGSQFYVDEGRIPGRTAAAINRASARGLHVVFVGDLPTEGLSGGTPAKEDRTVRRAIRAILARPTTARVAEQADVAGAVSALGARPAVRWSKQVPVYTQLRETKGARYYYLWNATGEEQSFTGSFTAQGAPIELDLWEGTFDPLAQFRDVGKRVKVPVTLEPHGTTVLMFRKGDRRPHALQTSADETEYLGAGRLELRDGQGGPQRVVLSDGRTRTIQMSRVSDAPRTVGDVTTGGPWSLQVTTYGPEGNIERPAIQLPVLADWRTIPGLTNESGIGTYTTQVTVPEKWVGKDRGTLLDLGEFHGSVQVLVNDRLVTSDVDPQEPVDVTQHLDVGVNDVQVVLATSPFNKAFSLPTTAITRPAWPTSLTIGPQPYGLLGEVQLVPYSRATVVARR